MSSSDLNFNNAQLSLWYYWPGFLNQLHCRLQQLALYYCIPHQSVVFLPFKCLSTTSCHAFFLPCNTSSLYFLRQMSKHSCAFPQKMSVNCKAIPTRRQISSADIFTYYKKFFTLHRRNLHQLSLDICSGGGSGSGVCSFQFRKYII